MHSLVRLGYLFLFWNLTAAVVIIEDQGHTLDAVIFGRITNDTLERIKTQLSNLQSNLKPMVGISAIHLEPPKQLCEINVETMMQQISSIQEQIRALTTLSKNQLDIIQSMKQEREDHNYIVKNIRKRQYQLAEQKIAQMADMVTNIPKIIKEVYDESEENFDLIKDFAKGMLNYLPCFYVLKALKTAVLLNDIDDPGILVTLAETLESKVLVVHSSSSEIKSHSARMFQNLQDSIKIKASEFLIAAMKADNYIKNQKVHSLTAAIADFRPELSDFVIDRLVAGTYDSLEPDTILGNILSHSRTPQAILGISTLFWKMKHFENFNNSAILNLASNLSKLQESYDFANLSDERKHIFSEVVKNLPTCIRNLFFEPRVCLWNVGRNAYLHAADSMFNYSDDRRRIFMSSAVGEKPPAGSSWFVEKYGNRILLKNVKYEREYFYVALFFYNNGPLRFVFSWIPGRNTDDQSAFTIEVERNQCLIKSDYTNEYLFASDVKYDAGDVFTYPFTTTGSRDVFQPTALWEIRGCDHV